MVVADCVEGFKSFDKGNELEMVRIPLFSEEWGFKSLKGLMFYFQTFFKVKRLLKHYAIEEIHCGRVIHEGVIAWLLKLSTGVPFKCFVHGEDVETAATSREQSLLVKQVCNNAEKLICNSQNSLNLVESLGFASAHKCEILNPGVDKDIFKPASHDSQFLEKYNWKDKTVLLTVGRLQQRKGQDYLIKAMPELLKTHPDLHYAVVGRGECEEELRALIKKLGVDESVSIYTDFSDDELVKAYQQCNFFILPNRTIGNDIEGFGMVLVEAQACGKYVFAGDSGGTKETMLVPDTGRIIDCSSPDKIASSLDVLLHHESDAALCREHAIDNFSWEQHVEKARKIGLL